MAQNHLCEGNPFAKDKIHKPNFFEILSNCSHTLSAFQCQLRAQPPYEHHTGRGTKGGFPVPKGSRKMQCCHRNMRGGKRMGHGIAYKGEKAYFLVGEEPAD
ncbi:hypothetical protein HS088_TW09G00102 [Tripterygium wilfordii]|uniref:Uncharacterized protein n=1 Tax=Tripterygium wilfordii TaxID=458696 RepID=A0A7J7D6Y5_TRIWF|nr:hypothetical protein HS088_TW09G00102 [Tripterygium wilfordii]